MKHLIIIGNGMVGHHCVEQLIALGATAHYQIHVFGEERHIAYDRVHLSEYFTGRDAESLALGTADEILAKHDENYMAPEVADSLAEHVQDQTLGLQEGPEECPTSDS